jgi:hypothetical protein
MSGNGTWQRNVLQLRKRIDLFNGKRIVAISTGPGLDPPDAVKDLFRGTVSDWLVMPNSYSRREVATFLPLWSHVRTEDPSEATFYAHAKGVTRPVNPGTTIHTWTRLMYETCLDYWPLVERTLARFPLAGTFKKVGRGFAGSDSSWHYSGTFYWARNVELFRRDWRRVDPVWWGTESYPGLHFGADEAGCLFHESVVPTLDLYSMGYLRGIVLPRYEAWKREHEHERTDWSGAEDRTRGRQTAAG